MRIQMKVYLNKEFPLDLLLVYRRIVTEMRTLCEIGMKSERFSHCLTG